MRPIFRSLALMMLGLAVAGAGATPALAEGRHALVIGIDAYREITPLQKAVGDAEALKSTLEDLGFTVDLVVDADRRALNRAVSEFQSKLVPGDTALIHFSGHGVELDGQNYLLPADIPSPKSGQQDFIKAEAISFGDLVQRVASSGAATRIFIIDACRDSPFAQAGSRGLGGTRGLTRVEAPAGTFILYSAGYNQTALDRLNDADAAPTSVYTRVLTEKMTEPGKPLAELAREVRSDVEVLAKSAGHEQRPAYYDELSGQFSSKRKATSLRLFRKQRLNLRPCRNRHRSVSAKPSMPPRQSGPRPPGRLSSDASPRGSTPTWRWPRATSSRVQPDLRSPLLLPRHLSLLSRPCRLAPIFNGAQY